MITYTPPKFCLKPINIQIHPKYCDFTKQIKGIWQQDILDCLFNNCSTDKFNKTQIMQNISNNTIVSYDLIEQITQKQTFIDDEIKKFNEYFVDTILQLWNINLESKLQILCEKESIYYQNGNVFVGNCDYDAIYKLMTFCDELNFHTLNIIEYFEQYLDKTDSDDDFDFDVSDFIEENFDHIDDNQFSQKLKHYLMSNFATFSKFTEIMNENYIVQPHTYLNDIIQSNKKYVDFIIICGHNDAK